jgi:MoaA/NifB/PqqE/SkfB family radical SAM enzyme
MKLEFFDRLPSQRATTAVASVLTPYINRDRLPRPFLMTVVVTHRCNSRCVMCNLWEEKRSPMLSLDEYRQIFRKPFPFVRVLTLTGGEPTLRSDLPDIFETIRAASPRLEHVELASHGMNVDRTLEQVETMVGTASRNPGRLRRFNLQLSLDGVGEGHNNVRRIPGGFDKVCRTLDGIARLRERYPMISSKLSCVVMPQNLDQVEPLRAFAAERGLLIHFSPAVLSGAYYRNLQDADSIGFIQGRERTEDARQVFGELAKDEASTLRFYYKDMEGMLAGGERGRSCMMGFYGFILEHTGEVYPCVNWEQQSFGSLLHEDFDDIWFGERAHAARAALRESGCPTCPALCYTLPTNAAELAQSTLSRFSGKSKRL